MKELKDKKWMISILVLFVIGCHPSVEVNENIYIDYEEIGIMHNEGLDRIYNKISSSNTIEENLLIVEIESRAMFNEHISYSKESENSFAEIVGVVNANNDKSFSKLNEDLILQMNSKISANQEGVASDMLLLMSTPGLSKIDFNLKFDEIEQLIYRTLNKDEQLAMLAGLYVGRSSYFYWQENSLKWQDKLAVPGVRISGEADDPPSGAAIIGGADLAGAITGAGSILVVSGVTGPIGWGFGALFTAGSALVTSGGAAIMVWANSK
jgi:hypothetical protein